MYIFSFKPQPTMEVNVQNQCSDLRLMHGLYSNTSAGQNEHSNWCVYDGNTISDGVRPFLTTFGGVLTYVLDRKDVKPDEKLEPTQARLCVSWKSEGYKKFRVFIQLVEYDKTFRWDIFNLNEYRQRYDNQLSAYTGPIKGTWLVGDDLVLMIRLVITISESVKDEHTKRPVWFDPKR
jgi:hypothetical protein